MKQRRKFLIFPSSLSALPFKITRLKLIPLDFQLLSKKQGARAEQNVSCQTMVLLNLVP